MSLLAQRFRETVSKSKDKAMSMEAKGNICYSTGFITFDFLNGYLVHVKDDSRNIEEKYYNLGIQDGTMNLFIGRSQSGKTTFAMQCGFNIIKNFPTAAFFHDDVEGGINDARKRVLTGLPLQELKKRYICRDSGVHTENFYDRIRLIYDEKLNNYKDYTYDTGKLDESGEPLIKLEPTVYLLDSMAMLCPKDLADENGLPSPMQIPGIAKKNTGMLRQITPMLKAANIILLIINHILPEISIMPKKGQLRYLKPGERITGGETQILLASNTIRFDDSKLKEKDGMGFEGAYVDVSLVKSRQNISGRAVTMVFDPRIGYDPDLSLLALLKANGKINSGGYMSIVGSDIKFRQKEFKEKLNDKSEVEFYNTVMTAVMEILKGMVVENEDDKILNRNERFDGDLIGKMNEMLKAA